ncbi:MAG: transcription antitermination factor NusB [Lachnospiraceae bacterium]|nr:transcription antitermination factor NusB [Lachnospiraceae bacterium]
MTRRSLRENVFKALFRMEFSAPEEKEEQLHLFLEYAKWYEDEDEDVAKELKPLSEKAYEYIYQKTKNIMSRLEEIDGKLKESSKSWSLERIGKAELTILRLAAYEILFDEEVPDKVAVNEAVELAKIYCKEGAASFINGVLGSLI